MWQLAHSRRFWATHAMTGLPSTATEKRTRCHVREVPLASLRLAVEALLFDHFVGDGEHA
jgi:hypothetical protein